MILPDIFRDVARRGRREDEQRVDDHEAHPAHRERDDDGNDDREKRLVPRGLHAARGGQLRMDGRQDQLIGAEHPEGCDRQQHERERADLAGRDGENVADQVFIEFGKAPAAHRGDEDAEGDCCGRKDADDRVRRLARAAADKGEQQRECHRQPDSPPDRQRRAAEDADGDAGEAGMAKRIGEEAHFACDDHRGEQAEERRHDDDGEQRVFHEVHRQKLCAERVAEGIPDGHSAPPPMWNARANSSEFSTSSGVPFLMSFPPASSTTRSQ